MIACDSHVHLFGPLSRYPAVPDSPYVVPDATPDELLALMDASGITHAVVVHAATSGRDNRRTLDALREHPTRLRGVLTPPLDTPDDATLRQWHALGVRGIRFSYTHTAQRDMAVDPRLAARIAALGWHAQVHVEGEKLAELESELAGLPCRVVIDHMARVPAARAADSPAFAALRRLLDRGNTWVKLSAPMRMSAEASPPYADVAPMARALVRQAPERVLWGTDWPHVNLRTPAPPYAALVAMIDDWVTDPGQRRQLLADNPAQVYSIDETA